MLPLDKRHPEHELAHRGASTAENLRIVQTTCKKDTAFLVFFGFFHSAIEEKKLYGNFSIDKVYKSDVSSPISIQSCFQI